MAYQQNLHFRQVFKVIEMMGYEWAKDLEHVAFGMVSLEEGGSMSTRKGKVVFLEDVLNRCVEKSLEIISEKAPVSRTKKNRRDGGHRRGDILCACQQQDKGHCVQLRQGAQLDGETGPYIQYTCVRANSAIEKAGYVPHHSSIGFEGLCDIECELVSLLFKFKDVLRDVMTKNEPSLLSRLLVDIAQCFNKFYFECKILADEPGVRDRRVGNNRRHLQGA